jgi:putative transposase
LLNFISKNRKKRLENYRALFKAQVNAELLKEIRESVNKGLALGGERFKKQIETLTDRRVTPRSRVDQKRL